MIIRPKDFELTFIWCEGTVPPPYYSEYRIQIGPGPRGLIKFWPDYPQYDAPVWEFDFPVKERTLDELFSDLTKSGAFTTKWPSPDELPVGGSLEWLEIRTGGQQFTIPSHSEVTPDISLIYENVQSQVPKRIWKVLRKRKAKFEENYPDF